MPPRSRAGKPGEPSPESPAWRCLLGVLIQDGLVAGISARAVVVLDADDKVAHAQLVPEIGQEPDHEAALAAAR